MNAYEAGKKMLCGDYTQYTPTGASYFQKAGRWKKLPEIGAIQYNFIASTGRIAHVAIVKECSIDHQNRTFAVKTIEGNTNAKTWERNGGMVAEKTYSNVRFDDVGVGSDTHIQGFGIPIFSSDTCSVSEFLVIAQGELGYKEKANSTLLGKTDDTATEIEKSQNIGTNNYTKYGKWYGQNGVAWCQQFVSWCAWMACKLHRKTNEKNGWDLIDNKWYYFENGTPVKGAWRFIDDRWYVFDNSGKMITGWFRPSIGELYFLAKDGGMCSNQWIEDNEEWIYLTSSGLMATDCYVYDRDMGKFCYVDFAGIWDSKYLDYDEIDESKEVIN